MKTCALIVVVLALAGCGVANRAQLDEGLRQCGNNETCRQNRLAEFEAREDARYRAKAAAAGYMAWRANQPAPPPIVIAPEQKKMVCQQTGPQPMTGGWLPAPQTMECR